LDSISSLESTQKFLPKFKQTRQARSLKHLRAQTSKKKLSSMLSKTSLETKRQYLQIGWDNSKQWEWWMTKKMMRMRYTNKMMMTMKTATKQNLKLLGVALELQSSTKTARCLCLEWECL
jgi:hypothetical protein